METYTQNQINNSLRILSEVFEEDQNYHQLPQESKAKLAEIMLRAFKIQPKSDQKPGPL